MHVESPAAAHSSEDAAAAADVIAASDAAAPAAMLLDFPRLLGGLRVSIASAGLEGRSLSTLFSTLEEGEAARLRERALALAGAPAARMALHGARPPVLDPFVRFHLLKLLAGQAAATGLAVYFKQPQTAAKLEVGGAVGVDTSSIEAAAADASASMHSAAASSSAAPAAASAGSVPVLTAAQWSSMSLDAQVAHLLSAAHALQSQHESSSRMGLPLWSATTSTGGSAPAANAATDYAMLEEALSAKANTPSSWLGTPEGLLHRSSTTRLLVSPQALLHLGPTEAHHLASSLVMVASFQLRCNFLGVNQTDLAALRLFSAPSAAADKKEAEAAAAASAGGSAAKKSAKDLRAEREKNAPFLMYNILETVGRFSVHAVLPSTYDSFANNPLPSISVGAASAAASASHPTNHAGVMQSHLSRILRLAHGATYRFLLQLEGRGLVVAIKQPDDSTGGTLGGGGWRWFLSHLAPSCHSAARATAAATLGGGTGDTPFVLAASNAPLVSLPCLAFQANVAAIKGFYSGKTSSGGAMGSVKTFRRKLKVEKDREAARQRAAKAAAAAHAAGGGAVGGLLVPSIGRSLSEMLDPDEEEVKGKGSFKMEDGAASASSGWSGPPSASAASMPLLSLQSSTDSPNSTFNAGPHFEPHSSLVAQAYRLIASRGVLGLSTPELRAHFNHAFGFKVIKGVISQLLKPGGPFTIKSIADQTGRNLIYRFFTEDGFAQFCKRHLEVDLQGTAKQFQQGSASVQERLKEAAATAAALQAAMGGNAAAAAAPAAMVPRPSLPVSAPLPVLPPPTASSIAAAAAAATAATNPFLMLASAPSMAAAATAAAAAATAAAAAPALSLALKPAATESPPLSQNLLSASTFDELTAIPTDELRPRKKSVAPSSAARPTSSVADETDSAAGSAQKSQRRPTLRAKLQEQWALDYLRSLPPPHLARHTDVARSVLERDAEKDYQDSVALALAAGKPPPDRPVKLPSISTSLIEVNSVTWVRRWTLMAKQGLIQQLNVAIPKNTGGGVRTVLLLMLPGPDTNDPEIKLHALKVARHEAEVHEKPDEPGVPDTTKTGAPRKRARGSRTSGSAPATQKGRGRRKRAAGSDDDLSSDDSSQASDGDNASGASGSETESKHAASSAIGSARKKPRTKKEKPVDLDSGSDDENAEDFFPFSLGWILPKMSRLRLLLERLWERYATVDPTIKPMPTTGEEAKAMAAASVSASMPMDLDSRGGVSVANVTAAAAAAASDTAISTPTGPARSFNYSSFLDHMLLRDWLSLVGAFESDLGDTQKAVLLLMPANMDRPVSSPSVAPHATILTQKERWRKFTKLQRVIDIGVKMGLMIRACKEDTVGAPSSVPSSAVKDPAAPDYIDGSNTDYFLLPSSVILLGRVFPLDSKSGRRDYWNTLRSTALKVYHVKRASHIKGEGRYERLQRTILTGHRPQEHIAAAADAVAAAPVDDPSAMPALESAGTASVAASPSRPHLLPMQHLVLEYPIRKFFVLYNIRSWLMGSTAPLSATAQDFLENKVPGVRYQPPPNAGFIESLARGLKVTKRMVAFAIARIRYPFAEELAHELGLFESSAREMFIGTVQADAATVAAAAAGAPAAEALVLWEKKRRAKPRHEPTTPAPSDLQGVLAHATAALERGVGGAATLTQPKAAKPRKNAATGPTAAATGEGRLLSLSKTSRKRKDPSAASASTSAPLLASVLLTKPEPTMHASRPLASIVGSASISAHHDPDHIPQPPGIPLRRSTSQESQRMPPVVRPTQQISGEAASDAGSDDEDEDADESAAGGSAAGTPAKGARRAVLTRRRWAASEDDALVALYNEWLTSCYEPWLKNQAEMNLAGKPELSASMKRSLAVGMEPAMQMDPTLAQAEANLAVLELQQAHAPLKNINQFISTGLGALNRNSDAVRRRIDALRQKGRLPVLSSGPLANLNRTLGSQSLSTQIYPRPLLVSLLSLVKMILNAAQETYDSRAAAALIQHFPPSSIDVVLKSLKADKWITNTKSNDNQRGRSFKWTAAVVEHLKPLVDKEVWTTAKETRDMWMAVHGATNAPAASPAAAVAAAASSSSYTFEPASRGGDLAAVLDLVSDGRVKLVPRVKDFAPTAIATQQGVDHVAVEVDVSSEMMLPLPLEVKRADEHSTPEKHHPAPIAGGGALGHSLSFDFVHHNLSSSWSSLHRIEVPSDSSLLLSEDFLLPPTGDASTTDSTATSRSGSAAPSRAHSRAASPTRTDEHGDDEMKAATPASSSAAAATAASSGPAAFTSFLDVPEVVATQALLVTILSDAGNEGMEYSVLRRAFLGRSSTPAASESIPLTYTPLLRASSPLFLRGLARALNFLEILKVSGVESEPRFVCARFCQVWTIPEMQHVQDPFSGEVQLRADFEHTAVRHSSATSESVESREKPRATISAAHSLSNSVFCVCLFV